MISEVANSLFLTYIASEYLLWDQHDASMHRPQRSRRSQPSIVKQFLQANGKRLGMTCFVTCTANLLDQGSGLSQMLRPGLESFFHMPKIVLAAILYLGALYVDVRRQQVRPLLTLSQFTAKVGRAFLKVLPAYPFLAVLISFIFLFLINLWEAIGLPDAWLNAPIYYGTLYGPFAWVYVSVKQQVLSEVNALPS